MREQRPVDEVPESGAWVAALPLGCLGVVLASAVALICGFTDICGCCLFC
jgi:hypothetical protein